MKQSELNHLRRLLGWVRCEIGQEPAAMVKTVQDIASKIEMTDYGKQAMVEYHDELRKVPKYIRAAVKALTPLVGGLQDVVDADASSAREFVRRTLRDDMKQEVSDDVLDEVARKVMKAIAPSAIRSRGAK